MLSKLVIPTSDVNTIELAKQRAEQPAHRIFCIDCSGSMYGELDNIRTQLKNKIPSSIRPQDFLTLIWFSGRNQFGTIFEHISINDLQDLTKINTAIDRYLRTVGFTGFVEPIELAKSLAQKYKEQPQIFFLTDGGENEWPIDHCKNTFQSIGSIPLVVVEYQYYCDRKFLQELASISNGTSVFNEDFEKYEATFETFMKNPINSTSLSVPVSTPDATVIFFDNNVINCVKASGSTVKLPEHIQDSYELQLNHEFVFPDDTRDKHSDLVKQVYLCMLYALHIKNHTILQHCVNVLGDIFITKMYSFCFSKQDYSRLAEHITNCITQPDTYAFKDGVDVNFKPRDDAFNVIQLLELLENDEKARFYPYNKAMKYKRISKEQKDDSGVVFVPNRELGCKFTLVHHQSRANISIGCMVYGHEVHPDGNIKPVTTYRNYAVLKDGIKNFNVLPCALSQETFNRLKQEGCIAQEEEWEANKPSIIDITNLPVVNRLFAKVNFTSTDFTTKHIELLHNKAQMKYVRHYMKQLKKAIEASADGGEEGEEESGDSAAHKRKKFDPNAVRDFYVANELQVKIAKCSTLPTINDKLVAKLDAGNKLTVSESLMLSIHQQYKTVENKPEHERLIWLEQKTTQLKVEASIINTWLEQAKMALLIACCWFTDVDGTKNTFHVQYQQQTYECQVVISDSKVYMD